MPSGSTEKQQYQLTIGGHSRGISHTIVHMIFRHYSYTAPQKLLSLAVGYHSPYIIVLYLKPDSKPYRR